MEEVRGVFRRERTPLWQAGMLYCRLVASDGRVVGERTIPAPDHVCFVLDPNVSTEAPVVARLTPDAPVLFQVRFDGIAEAVRLDVHRISTDTRPADSATPIGPLLGSIAIPGK